MSAELSNSTLYLQNIEDLRLSRAGMLRLSDRGFRDYDSLVRLNISQTGLREIKAGWFSRSNNLQFLDMSHNELTILNRDHLRTLQKLLVANFSYNDIEEVQAHSFQDLLMLQELYLNFNQIGRISSLGQLSHLQVLDMSDNSIDIVRIRQNFYYLLQKTDHFHLYRFQLMHLAL